MKIFNRFIIIASIATMFPAAARAAGPAGAGLRAAVGALEQGYDSLTDMQAEFKQTTFIASMKRQERGAGDVSIKKAPGAMAMFRFDYTTPRQQIISNGKKVWYYLPENKQVMVSDVKGMFEGSRGIALNYLTGMGHISRDFSISFTDGGRDKKGNYLLELIPKKPTRVLTKLILTVQRADVEQYENNGKVGAAFPVVSSVVFDSFGNRTTIEFSKIRVNRGISSTRFNFRIPAGTEIMR